MIQKAKNWLRQLYLNMGAYFLRKGAGLTPGMKIELKTAVKSGMKGHAVRRGVKKIWIKNMYFNFRLNKIVYSFTHRKPTNALENNEPSK